MCLATRHAPPDLPDKQGDPEFRRESRDEGICLGLVARQRGLIEGEDVFFGDPKFVNGRPILSDEGLNRIYNAADLYLTTSLGEGWGLGVTEAMAAGTPIAGPAWLHPHMRFIAGEEKTA